MIGDVAPGTNDLPRGEGFDAGCFRDPDGDGLKVFCTPSAA